MMQHLLSYLLEFSERNRKGLYHTSTQIAGSALYMHALGCVALKKSSFISQTRANVQGYTANRKTRAELFIVKHKLKLNSGTTDEHAHM